MDAYWTDETIDYFEEITYSCRWKTLKLTLNDNKANSSDKHKLPVNLFDVKKVCIFISICDVIIYLKSKKISLTIDQFGAMLFPVIKCKWITTISLSKNKQIF